ncbi:MAG: hypothetical protein JW818_16155 [Pirellulales bacterium]|nr:hypothetical protein [Pirellulales bacterium]
MQCRLRILAPAGLFLLALMLPSLTGCGDGRPKRVPVSGQVLIDGKPLTFGFVQVKPGNARSAYAQIGSDGRFTLTTFGGNDGVVLGTHPVAVKANEQLSETRIRWHAPKKYADTNTSGLTITIDHDTRELPPFELSWEGGKPFVETVGTGAGH